MAASSAFTSPYGSFSATGSVAQKNSDIMEEYRMKNSALLVIDLQNDITKNYREIIEKVNAAIKWAVQMDLWIIY